MPMKPTFIGKKSAPIKTRGYAHRHRRTAAPARPIDKLVHTEAWNFYTIIKFVFFRVQKNRMQCPDAYAILYNIIFNRFGNRMGPVF
jgi:hypothetical protein